MIIGIDIRVLMDVYYSGVSEYTFNLLKALFEIDSQNQYKLFYNSWSDYSKRIPNFEKDNVEVIKTNYPNKIFNYIMQRQFNSPRIDKLLGVDVFFAPHINFLSLSQDTRKIITIHDLSFLRYPDFFSARKNFWHKMIDVRKMLGNFDKIIAVSENTKRDIVDLCGVDGKRVEVIYSAIDADFRKLNKTDLAVDARLGEVREKYGLGEKFILCLGTIEPRKNIDGVIRAYDLFIKNNPKYSEYNLVLAGGSGWKTGDIFRTLKNSPNKNKIKFLGYVERNEKVYLYNLAKIFFYPSFYEGFGLPPLEAMACGAPVITSDSSSIPEIVGGSALLVDPYNISKMSDVLSWLVHNIESGSNRFCDIDIDKKNWQEVAKDYLNSFMELNAGH